MKSLPPEVNSGRKFEVTLFGMVAITDIVRVIIFIIDNIVKLVCFGKLTYSYLVYNISVFKLNT